MVILPYSAPGFVFNWRRYWRQSFSLLANFNQGYSSFQKCADLWPFGSELGPEKSTRRVSKPQVNQLRGWSPLVQQLEEVGIL